MAVDIQQLFNEVLPGQVAKFPDAAKQIGNTFQINITGDGGGEWHVNATEADGGPSAGPGNKPADVTITIAVEDFQKLLENPQANGMQLFFAGKLKVAGSNPMLAMKLNKLFTLGQ
jgi:putative sterol carrier protein